MTVVFRTDIGPHTGKGSPLTKEEVDGNFYDLLTRTEDIENDVAFACESVDYTGASITFNWSDDTSSGPFMLPVATFHAVGEWLNSMPLSYLDVFTVTGTGTFLTLIDHTTPPFPAPFDPAAVSEDTDTAGDPLYLMIAESVDTADMIKYRGEYEAGETYLVGESFTHFEHGYFLTIEGFTADFPFDRDLIDDKYALLAPPSFPRVETTTETNYTLTPADAGAYLRFSNGCAITIPLDLAVNAGTEIHFRQCGEGSVTFVEVLGVTLNPQREGFSTSTAWTGATVTAKYVGVNVWDLIGPPGEEMSA